MNEWTSLPRFTSHEFVRREFHREKPAARRERACEISQRTPHTEKTWDIRRKVIPMWRIIVRIENHVEIPEYCYRRRIMIPMASASSQNMMLKKDGK
jgi:hypothetical protein